MTDKNYQEIKERLSKLETRLGTLSPLSDDIEAVKKELQKLHVVTRDELQKLHVATEKQASSLETIDTIIEGVKDGVDRTRERLKNDLQLSFNQNVVDLKSEIHAEVDRINTYNKERLEGVRQDLEGLRDRDIKSLGHQLSLLDDKISWLKERVEKLPTIDDIEERLTDEKRSPIATRNQMSNVKQELNNLSNEIKNLPKIDQIEEKFTDEKNTPLATRNQMFNLEKEVKWVKGVLTVNLVTIVAFVIAAINFQSNITRRLTPTSSPQSSFTSRYSSKN